MAENFDINENGAILVFWLHVVKKRPTRHIFYL